MQKLGRILSSRRSLPVLLCDRRRSLSHPVFLTSKLEAGKVDGDDNDDDDDYNV